jgi:crotonobetainyl-CoA:carnitine CoA-transferase CaiB-like acyl-CoA transferase
MENTRMDMPLAGIKIVDLTSAVVGPYATQILADYGAEVIKVEERAGDIIRWISGRSRTPGMSGKFMHMNRNKRSISLNLKADAGLDALLRLVAGADVFVHNMRPDAARRLGITYERLLEVNPRLVYCSIVGFGQEGRYRSRPAYDSILQGGTSLANLFAAKGGEPRYVPYVVVDRTAGLMVTHTLMAALFGRQRDGLAREIQIPMFESFATVVLSEHMYGKTFDPPIGTSGDARLLDPNAKPVATRDGYICITTNTDAQVLAMFDAFGKPQLKADDRFNTALARIEHIAAFFQLRAEEIACETTDYWMQVFERHDVPAMPCHTLESLLQDKHLDDVGLLEKSVHPTQGEIWNINVPTKMTGFTPEVRLPAPHIGEHTADVLGELGYGLAEIDAMLASGAAFETRQNASPYSSGSIPISRTTLPTSS